MDKLDVELDDMLITSISNINEIRREAIHELEEKIIQTFMRNSNYILKNKCEEDNIYEENLKVSLCLNNMSEYFDYEKIEDIDNVYIPLRFFVFSKYKSQIQKICNKYNTYILMPSISKSNYENINIDEILKNNIKGVVVSNLSQIEQFKAYKKIANYTFNIANENTIRELQNMGISKYIISPEFEKETSQSLSNAIEKETLVYGRILLMTTEYCTIGTYKNCTGMCENGVYKLKDRIGLEFPILTDRINCNNLIYNSKIISINWKDLNVNSIRIDILDETVEEINNIIKIHRSGGKLEGKDYTNGNLKREI